MICYCRVSRIINCFEEKGIYHIATWHINADFVARLCAIINSSVNFIVYCYAGKQFRSCLFHTLRSVICKDSGTVKSILLRSNSQVEIFRQITVRKLKLSSIVEWKFAGRRSRLQVKLYHLPQQNAQKYHKRRQFRRK